MHRLARYALVGFWLSWVVLATSLSAGSRAAGLDLREDAIQEEEYSLSRVVRMLRRTGVPDRHIVAAASIAR